MWDPHHWALTCRTLKEKDAKAERCRPRIASPLARESESCLTVRTSPWQGQIMVLSRAKWVPHRWPLISPQALLPSWTIRFPFSYLESSWPWGRLTKEIRNLVASRWSDVKESLGKHPINLVSMNCFSRKAGPKIPLWGLIKINRSFRHRAHGTSKGKAGTRLRGEPCVTWPTCHSPFQLRIFKNYPLFQAFFSYVLFTPLHI